MEPSKTPRAVSEIAAPLRPCRPAPPTTLHKLFGRFVGGVAYPGISRPSRQPPNQHVELISFAVALSGRVGNQGSGPSPVACRERQAKAARVACWTHQPSCRASIV
ncbi:hypothetical protein H0G86_011137 [Trichoderma simmonsii]|uniref:Uncharacterized protein n=1 Tax=Trichoderma simmonsii TaxID=1491479 RepID=A0A8G0LKY2_9HYPO|nr:hypothetical protein H0G86_011137 [Trichoderma simmonsii]